VEYPPCPVQEEKKWPWLWNFLSGRWVIIHDHTWFWDLIDKDDETTALKESQRPGQIT
jgi:hypothetical protein